MSDMLTHRGEALLSFVRWVARIVMFAVIASAMGKHTSTLDAIAITFAFFLALRALEARSEAT